MARFIGLLLIGPWLVVLGFVYWLYVRRRAANGISAGFDAGVLIVAAISTIAFSGWAFTAGAVVAARPGIDPVWKQMAAAWAAYPAYFIVLFLGLARHWIAGRRRRRAGRTAVGGPGAAR